MAAKANPPSAKKKPIKCGANGHWNTTEVSK